MGTGGCCALTGTGGRRTPLRDALFGPRTGAVPFGKHATTCPVTAWRTWATAADLSDGRAFRAIDRHGNLAGSIAGQAIGTAITRAAEHAGLLVHVTAHSLRAGLATEARRAGHDPITIARTTADLGAIRLARINFLGVPAWSAVAVVAGGGGRCRRRW